MLPSFPGKVPPRKVISVVVLILIALIAGLALAARNGRNPNSYMTPIFSITVTPR